MRPHDPNSPQQPAHISFYYRIKGENDFGGTPRQILPLSFCDGSVYKYHINVVILLPQKKDLIPNLRPHWDSKESWQPVCCR